MFLRYDADNSGGIDAGELSSIFSDVNERMSRHELAQLMREFGSRTMATATATAADGDDGELECDFDGFGRMIVALQRRGRLGGLFDFDSSAGMTSVLSHAAADLDAMIVICRNHAGRSRAGWSRAKTAAARRSFEMPDRRGRLSRPASADQQRRSFERDGGCLVHHHHHHHPAGCLERSDGSSRKPACGKIFTQQVRWPSKEPLRVSDQFEAEDARSFSHRFEKLLGGGPTSPSWITAAKLLPLKHLNASRHRGRVCVAG
jgi:hypothetical protein